MLMFDMQNNVKRVKSYIRMRTRIKLEMVSFLDLPDQTGVALARLGQVRQTE